MTQPISQAAQAVREAAKKAWCRQEYPVRIVAAALRVIASEVYFRADKNMILSIASELEGL